MKITVEDPIVTGYVMALRHAYDRLDINFLAHVDNAVTLKEFADWIKEKEAEYGITPREADQHPTEA